MNHYEIMYIVPLKVGDDEASTATQDKVRTMLTTEGASITKEELMGKRKLAYPINHIRHGIYVVLECELDPAKMKRINDWFRLSTEILRAQIIARVPKSEVQVAKEKALQDKLAKLHAQTEMTTKREEVSKVTETVEPKTHEKPKIKLEELDAKLDQILEQEMVK